MPRVLNLPGPGPVLPQPLYRSVPVGTGYRGLVLSDGPVGYWRLGEPSGTTTVDISGNGLNGTYNLAGVTLGQPGVLIGDADTAADFSGSSSESNLSNPVALRLSGNWSLEGWCRIPSGQSITAEHAIVAQDLATTINWLLGFIDIGGGSFSTKPSVGFYSPGWHIAQSPDALTEDIWHHVVGTWDQTTLRLYVDGIEKDTDVPAAVAPTSTANFYIGRDAGGLFKGRLDEVAVYGTVLTPMQVANHYLTGHGLLNSAEGGTSGVDVTSGVGGNTGGASGDYFNGEVGAALASFSNAHPATGTMGYRMSNGATSQTDGVYWQHLAANKEIYGRAYLYLSALPGTGELHLDNLEDGTFADIAHYVLQFSDDKLWAYPGLGGGTSSTMTFSASTMYRIEWHTISHATGGVMEARIYASHSLTPLETIGPLTGLQNLGTDIDYTRFMFISDTTTASDVWVDDVGVSTITWLGPSGVDAAGSASYDPLGATGFFGA